jgi:Ca-activated chloride channel family protein
MDFIWPAMLVCLALIPFAAWLYVRSQRLRRQAIARHGGFGLLQATGGRPLGRRRHLPPALFLLGLGLLALSLARPQAEVSLPRVVGTVILAFDVSGSMAADDVQPTRMEAAKAAAREFVERQPPTVQIGVVAFSEGGLAVQRPTDDRDAITAAINRLTPQRGTSLGQGVLAALNLLASDAGQGPRLYSARLPTPTPVPVGTEAPAAIVLLTDGENNAPPAPELAAQRAAEQGVRIYTVGVGSAAGATIQVEGFTIHTQLDEATLQGMAQISGGAYYNAENDEELRAVYNNLSLGLMVKPETMEITALIAGAGALALLIGGICSLFWFGRVP